MIRARALSLLFEIKTKHRLHEQKQKSAPLAFA